MCEVQASDEILQSSQYYSNIRVKLTAKKEELKKKQARCDKIDMMALRNLLKTTLIQEWRLIKNTEAKVAFLIGELILICNRTLIIKTQYDWLEHQKILCH